MLRVPRPKKAITINVVIITMDTHVASAIERALARLRKVLPGLDLSVHAASEWSADPRALARCLESIESANIVVLTMLFLEEHFQPLLPVELKVLAELRLV